MRRPYAQLYHVSEWGIHRSYDHKGLVLQVDLGRLGITIPIRRQEA
jgi:hypothetical protein